MCGRYTLIRQGADIIHDELDAVAITVSDLFWRPRYNAAPGQFLPVLISGSKGLSLETLRWGLVPAWAKDEKMAWSLINARSETVAAKPAFRAAFRSRRCVVPADGFYEWRRTGPVKEPWRFLRPGGRGFLMAGLWEEWHPEGREPLRTFCLLTTTPNAVTAPIHDRMPVLLPGNRAQTWLDPHATPESLEVTMQPAADDFLVRYAVSPRVNNARHDAPDCIEPLPAAP